MSRRQWASRVVRTVLMVGGVATLVGFAMKSEWTGRRIARVVEAGLEITTGERAVIGSLQIDPFRLSADVQGLVLSHGIGGEASSILAVDRVGIQLGLRPWLHRLEIERPVLRLHLDEDGIREFRNASSVQQGGQGLPWKYLSIMNARVILEAPDGSVLLEGVDIRTSEGDRVDIQVETARLRWKELDQVARQVEWKDVQLTPQRIWVPDLDLRTADIELMGSIAAQLDGPLGGDLSMAVDLSLFNPILADGEDVGGRVHMDLSLTGSTEEPTFAGPVLVQGLEYTTMSHDGKPGTAELPQGIARLHWQGRHLRFEEAELQWAGGLLGATGNIDLESLGVQVNATLHAIDLSDAIRQGGGHPDSWTTFEGDGELHMAGVLEPLELEGTFDLALQNLIVGTGPARAPTTNRILDLPSVALGGQLSVRDDGVRIQARELNSGSTRGSIDGFIGFNWFGPLDISVDLPRANLATFRPLNDLDLWGRGWFTGRVQGPFSEVQITGDIGIRDFALEGISFADEVTASVSCKDLQTLRFQELRARRGQTHYNGDVDVIFGEEVTLDLALEITEGRIRDIAGAVSDDFSWLDGSVAGLVTLQGDPQAMDGDVLLEFRDVDLIDERFASGTATGWIDHGRVTIEQLALSRWNGEEGVLARGTIADDWEMNLDVVATGLQLNRLDHLARVNWPLRGRMSIDASVTGTLLNPEPRGRLAVRDTWFAGQPVADSTVFFEPQGDALLLEGHVLGTGIGFEGELGRSDPMPLHLTAALDALPLHTLYPIASDGNAVEALLTGQITVDGTLSNTPQIEFDADWDELSLVWDRHSLKTQAPWSVSVTGRSVELEGLHLVGEGTDLKWSARSDAEGVISSVGGGRMDADLARMVVPGLQRAEGPIEVDIKVEGTVAEPQVAVDVALCGVTMQSDWFPHPIESLFGVATVSADETELRSLSPEKRDADWLGRTPGLATCVPKLARAEGIQGIVGDGTVRLRGGMGAKGWMPSRYNLGLEAKDIRVQYLDFLPPMVGDASLVFDGPVDSLLMSGRIDVEEMVFSDRIDWEDWLLEITEESPLGEAGSGEAALFQFDLEVVSSQTVRMRNNVADLTAGGELRVVGDTARPGLIGQIRATPGGRVYLKEREFEVQRGEVLFVEPYTFDPQLDIVLMTDVRAREQEYDVVYRVGGTYEDWRAETISDPPLPQADVNALLLFGMTRDELERYGGLSGALAVEGGDLLASKVLFTGRTGDERGGLFRIVDPLRPDRLDLVSGVSERGSGLVTSELRLLYENELDDVGLPGTLMIFEQNISRSSDTYLGLEQRLARKLFARMYWGSEQQGRHLAVGGAYGLEMKVRWELD